MGGEDSGAKVLRRIVPDIPNGLPHLGFLHIFLELPFQGVLAGLTKWEPRDMDGVFLVHSHFYAGRGLINKNVKF